MTRTPMPSPRGTNYAGRYLPAGSRVTAAFDAEPDDDADIDFSALLAFLGTKLDDGDLAKVRRMLGLDSPDLDSSGEGASDRAARHAFDAKVRDQHRRGYITQREMERALMEGPRRQPTEADRARFKEMFPNADRLKVL